MPQLDLESDHFSWDDQIWANLSNEIANNSEGDKQTLVPEAVEDKGKKRSRGGANKEKGKEENVEKKDGELSDHDTHIWTERERRKKMRNMFSSLHTLLPQLPPKADKSTIVDEAVSYIKALQATLQRLQKQKLERLQGGPSKCLAPEASVAATSKLAVLATRETFLADQVASMNGNTNKNNSSAVSKASTSISASASHLPATIQTWTSPNVVLNICGNDGHFTVYAPKKPGLFASLCSALENNKIEVVTSHISSDADRCVYMIQARLAKGASDDQFAETVTIEEMCRQAAAEMMMYVG